MIDARYFYATGYSVTGGNLQFPRYAYIGNLGEPLGQVAGIAFKNVVEDTDNDRIVITIGSSTLTAPDGTDRVIVQAVGSARMRYNYAPDVPYGQFTDTSVSLYLLDDGTLVILERDDTQSFSSPASGVDVERFMSGQTNIVLSSSGTVTIPADTYNGSFGGQAGMTCFAAGTLVATLRGPRPVEAIRPGDLVLTRDRGYRPVRWAGQQRLSAVRLAVAERLRPVRIAAGALGPGMPARDMLVSPQHRMLLSGAEVAHRFGTTEVLAAAKHLVGLPGVSVDCPVEGVTYVHLLFDMHEILLADGAWSESLYTGPWAMKMLPAAQRAELLTLFPDLAQGTTAHAAPARRFLTGREARDLRRGPATAPAARDAHALHGR